jgi:polyhydroxyalkanoate synthesis regulator phasin
MENRDYANEILETMTYEEAKELLAPLMQSRIEKKKDLDKRYRRIKMLVKKYHAPGVFEYNFSIDSIWILYGATEDHENQKQLDTLERQYRWNETRKPHFVPKYTFFWEDNSARIQSAKQFPIENLYNNPLKRSGSNRLIGLCPFHQERRSSFTIYTDTITFYCFGCGAKGDSITFYQKLYGVPFWEAVKQMTGSY